jgi:hypothetical protein
MDFAKLSMLSIARDFARWSFTTRIVQKGIELLVKAEKGC